jgi:putative SOS response-associated peptidase YedK
MVPASGFYERRRLDPKNKQPFAFDLLNGKMMAFAGLWDAWKDPANGQWLQSYTIITTDANELMAKVHDRMPVILHPGDYDRWLDRDFEGHSGIDKLHPAVRRPRENLCLCTTPLTVLPMPSVTSRTCLLKRHPRVLATNSQALPRVVPSSASPPR